MPKELRCTEYKVFDEDYSEWRPCKCPVCGAFLKWSKISDVPKCNKCGAGLLVVPERDEETGEELDYGKICPISLAKKKKA